MEHIEGTVDIQAEAKGTLNRVGSKIADKKESSSSSSKSLSSSSSSAEACAKTASNRGFGEKEYFSSKRIDSKTIYAEDDANDEDNKSEDNFNGDDIDQQLTNEFQSLLEAQPLSQLSGYASELGFQRGFRM